MTQPELVANELFEAGFNTSRVVGFPVIEVWLDSRKVTTIEVERVLDQLLEGCSFKITSRTLQTVKSNPEGVEVILQ